MLSMTSLILTVLALASLAPRLERSSFCYCVSQIVQQLLHVVRNDKKAGVEGG